MTAVHSLHATAVAAPIATMRRPPALHPLVAMAAQSRQALLRLATAALLVLLLPLLLLMAAGPACAAPQDLLDVWQQARQANPQLAAAQAQRGVQHERAMQARAALLPQAELGATQTRPHNSSSTASSSPRHVVDLSLTQVVFDLGRLRTLDAEHTLAQAQDAQVRAAEQALAARVARVYFGLLSAQAALATAQANEAALATQADQAQARFAAGLVALVDVEQSRTHHALARGHTVAARQVQADAQAALAEVTGQPAAELRPLAADLPAGPPQPADVQAWTERALQAHPRLAALQLGLAAGGQRVAAARAAHLPTLSASLDSQRSSGAAGAGASGLGASGAGGGGQRQQTQLALRLTVPLWAGGATASAVRQAAHERDALREALEAERRAVLRDARAQHQAVLAGAELVASTATAAAAADRALAATRSGHTLGTRSNTDLLLALQTQAQARRAHDDARHGYVLAQLLLQQAAGSLGPDELAAANQLLQGAR